MNENVFIVILALLITGYTYFTFEVVLPHAEAKSQEIKSCEEKGGVMIEQSNLPDLCIKREHIIAK